MLKKTINILCLHGHYANANILRYQMRDIIKNSSIQIYNTNKNTLECNAIFSQINDSANMHFDFVNAPFAIYNVDESLNHLFGNNDLLYRWYKIPLKLKNEPYSFMTNRFPNMHFINFFYENMFNNFFAEQLQNGKKHDIIIGCSQGCAIASILLNSSNFNIQKAILFNSSNAIYVNEFTAQQYLNLANKKLLFVTSYDKNDSYNNSTSIFFDNIQKIHFYGNHIIPTINNPSEKQCIDKIMRFMNEIE